MQYKYCIEAGEEVSEEATKVLDRDRSGGLRGGYTSTG